MARSVEVLSTHETEARFVEVAVKNGVESAVFRITRYIKYERMAPTASGEQQQLIVPLEQTGAIADKIRSLKPGQAVALKWFHEYVTLANPDGTTRHFPLRNIQTLEPCDARSSEVLSIHETEAKFSGLQNVPCHFRTALCPDRCNHGGDAASFEIVSYLRYVKPGQHGDPQKVKFQVKLSDAGLFADRIRALSEGQTVRLNWVHEYVTIEDQEGRKTHRPERTITLLETR
eukprot:GGOE01053941.1.p1 GENE.GGOE01053941.1~~GGOE01053941.1.p1  ORF type:complete len:241 (+),score=62.91 GGOE01053941.1:31-723(+)